MNTNDLLIQKVLGNDAKILHPLVGGMMNQSFVVEANNKKYVLYVSTEQANEMVDRCLERDNQRIVYELGITSKNVYFDTNKGIKINEYIEGSSLDKTDKYDVEKVASLLKKLHSSKTLSAEDYNPFGRFIGYENEALAFQDLGKEYSLLRKEVFDHKDLLEKREKTLCHNDAQKSNIVKDINDDYFLIDFEFMSNNDPIYDIATFGNGLVEEGYDLLLHYFKNPSLLEKQVYYLWRIFVSLQWHNVAIVKHYRGEGKTHGFDFLKVAEFFLHNAQCAYTYLKELN